MPKNKKLFLSNAFLLFLLSVLFCVPVRASATTWTQKYGGEGREVFTSIVEASDGGFVIGGYTDSFGAGDDDFWLIKTDSLGNIEWNKTYGEESWDQFHSLVKTFDGGYALAGNKDGDFWLVKTDAQGNMEWNQTYGDNYELGKSLVQTSDCGYAVVGSTGPLASYEDTICLLVKTDESGNMEWNQTFPQIALQRAFSVVESSDGGLAIASGPWLVKTDAQGNMEWNQSYYETVEGGVSSLIVNSDGGYVLAGSSGHACWLLKTDSNGNVEWTQIFTAQSWVYVNSLIETFDGGYAIAGSAGINFWLIKTDSQGNREWDRTIGGKILDRAHSLVQTSDGGYALAGFTHSYSVDYEDAWVVKTDAQGNVPEHHVYITASGKVEGTDKIQRNGDIYTFTDDIFVYYFFVEKDHIVVDGNGFTLYGSGAQGGGTGFDLTTRENVTIRNTNIQNLTIGIHLQTCIWNTILGNNISNNNIGIHTQTSAHNFMFENNITNNKVGVSFRSMSATFSSWASNNTVYSNNFVNNNQQISITPHTGDNMIVNALNKGALGNYWSDYNGTDVDGDGIGDTPHVIDENNQDNYPLVKHYIIPEFPSWSTLLLTLIAFTATVIICKHKLHVKPRLTKSPQK